jgi:DNA repair protein RecO (recombination protein O)
MTIVETEAIILSTRDYGESDRLITFYTLKSGKLRGIAKGARRSRKRFVHAFEPNSAVQLTYRERKSSIWIEACKLLEPHLALREEVERWGYAALISEVILELVPEGEAQEELFSLLKGALGQLSRDKDPLNVVLLFMFRFLDTMGYLPALESCSICRRPLKSSTRWWWRVSQGMLTCSDHSSVYDDYLLLDLGTLVLIQQSRLLPLDRVWRLRLSQEKKLPLLRGMVSWVRDHTGRCLRSLKLLEQVQSI